MPLAVPISILRWPFGPCGPAGPTEGSKSGSGFAIVSGGSIPASQARKRLNERHDGVAGRGV